MSQPKADLPSEVENALTYLSDRDAGAFRRKFESQAHVPRERDHTFLELAAGVYVARLGFVPLYERVFGGLTPDWQVTGPDDRPVFFADVLTFHPAEGVEKEQTRQLEAEGMFCDFVPPNEARLYGILQDKATKYKMVGEDASLPLVIFVFGCFNTLLQGREVWNCLNGEHGLFGLYPHLSGVCHFETFWTLERGQVYEFQVYANEGASRPLDFPSGFVPRPIPATGV